MKLVFGVIDLPYSYGRTRRKKKKGKTIKPKKLPSTGDVAGWLENKYHVMEVFFHSKESGVIKSLEDSVEEALENLMMGAPTSSINPYAGGTSEIENLFKKFISSREIETLGIPGVPTKAALNGISHRLKKKKGQRRPSFIDTGLYTSSFKAWIE
jgi:hypothetical protein